MCQASKGTMCVSLCVLEISDTHRIYRYSCIEKYRYSICQQPLIYTLSEARSGVNWADLMAAQGAFGTDFYDRCIVPTIFLVDLS